MKGRVALPSAQNPHAPEPMARGFVVPGEARVRITIEGRKRRLVIDWSRVEPDEEPRTPR